MLTATISGWHKSSRSGANGGDYVEIAVVATRP
ncbi:DUF397 domain-containing protein [Actinoallomurus vinaceus]